MPMLRMQVKKMVEDEYVAVPVLELLTNCVAAKMNFVFCGEPGAGKTECAKFFSQFIPAGERVITIEDNPEWHYSQINPGKDCVELRINPDFDYTKAIKTCLRQNPSWIMSVSYTHLDVYKRQVLHRLELHMSVKWQRRE